MMYHTLGTVLALVASHTGTIIVIYSCIGTICLVFARMRITVVDIWKREINGGKFRWRETEEWLNQTYVTSLSTRMWSRREMTYHTSRTVLALVASRTGTTIVIYFNSTSCTVFARFRFTVVDIWKKCKSKSNISNLPPQYGSKVKKYRFPLCEKDKFQVWGKSLWHLPRRKEKAFKPFTRMQPKSLKRNRLGYNIWSIILCEQFLPK